VRPDLRQAKLARLPERMLAAQLPIKVPLEMQRIRVLPEPAMRRATSCLRPVRNFLSSPFSV
jgi:hypothetical protein